jgi:hypothetical protein
MTFQKVSAQGAGGRREKEGKLGSLSEKSGIRRKVV